MLIAQYTRELGFVYMLLRFCRSNICFVNLCLTFYEPSRILNTMDEKILCQIGLSKSQAHVYRLLVERKSLRPSQLEKITHESRANCYALLDKLVEIGLAKRIDVDKKLTYFAESPVSLEKILSERVAEQQHLLQSVQMALPRMLSAFNEQRTKTRVNVVSGKENLAQLYQDQMEQNDRHLYFVRSIADVPYFGFDEMHRIRSLAHNYKKRRYGITPVVFFSPERPRDDASTNLKRTWLPKGSYTSPVEWVVCDDTLYIINFRGDGTGITIKDPFVADSFRQIFSLFSEYIKKDPEYETSPKFHRAPS